MTDLSGRSGSHLEATQARRTIDSPGRLRAAGTALLALAGLLVAVAAGCGGPDAEEAEPDRDDEVPGRDSLVTVRSSALDLAGLTETRPRPGRVARTVSMVGRLEVDPAGRSVVRAPASGRFRLRARSGDRVTGGDTLGWIESPETYPDSLPLTAPSGGRVLDLPGGPSGLAEAWSPLAILASTDTLRLVLPVPPSRYGDVREGTLLVVGEEPDADAPAGGADVRARVDGFLEPGGEASRLRATARMPNPGGRREAGMRVPVAVALDDSLSGHWVPDPSVLYDRRRPDRTVVFVRRGDGYVQAPVEVGARTADSVFLTSGVEGRDTVVVRGSYQLLYADFNFRGIGAEAGEMEEGEEDEDGS